MVLLAPFSMRTATACFLLLTISSISSYELCTFIFGTFMIITISGPYILLYMYMRLSHCHLGRTGCGDERGAVAAHSEAETGWWSTSCSDSRLTEQNSDISICIWSHDVTVSKGSGVDDSKFSVVWSLFKGFHGYVKHTVSFFFLSLSLLHTTPQKYHHHHISSHSLALLGL